MLSRAQITRVLLIVTTFNRRDLTLKFLHSLHHKVELSKIELKILLVDDRSSDGTAESVARLYPDVEVLHGTGSLYWAGAVKVGLERVGSTLDSYDALLLANDDIEFFQNSIQVLIQISKNNNAIVGGAVVDRDGRLEASGGNLGLICKPKIKRLKPNGNIQKCDVLPGHILYIPTELFFCVGGFDKNFTYSYLDLSFTLKASKSGKSVLLAPFPLAYTNDYHDHFVDWCNRRGTIKELFQMSFFSPKGPYWREAVHYLKLTSRYFWWFWLPFYYRGFWISIIVNLLVRCKIMN